MLYMYKFFLYLLAIALNVKKPAPASWALRLGPREPWRLVAPCASNNYGREVKGHIECYSRKMVDFTSSKDRAYDPVFYSNTDICGHKKRYVKKGWSEPEM